MGCAARAAHRAGARRRGAALRDLSRQHAARDDAAQAAHLERDGAPARRGRSQAPALRAPLPRSIARPFRRAGAIPHPTAQGSARGGPGGNRGGHHAPAPAGTIAGRDRRPAGVDAGHHLHPSRRRHRRRPPGIAQRGEAGR